MGTSFGEALKAIREKNGWTLEEMAERLNSTKQALSRYERGERTPKITVAAKFAEVLNVDLSVLIGEDGSHTMELKAPDELPPKTLEARVLAKGIDRMPQQQREAIVKMMTGLYPGLFDEKGTDENDA